MVTIGASGSMEANHAAVLTAGNEVYHFGQLLRLDAIGAGIVAVGILPDNANGEERMRGPHTLVFVNGRRMTIRDVSFVDSANYAIYFQVSDQVLGFLDAAGEAHQALGEAHRLAHRHRQAEHGAQAGRVDVHRAEQFIARGVGLQPVFGSLSADAARFERDRGVLHARFKEPARDQGNHGDEDDGDLGKAVAEGTLFVSHVCSPTSQPAGI